MCKICELNNKTDGGWEGERVIINEKLSIGIFSDNCQEYPLLLTYLKDIDNGKEIERYSEFIELGECPFCGIKFNDEYFKRYEEE